MGSGPRSLGQRNGGSFENGLQYCYLLLLLIRKDNAGTA